MLAATGQPTERRLELAEDRRLPSREAHVTRQGELAPGGADPALDLGDADQAARAQVPEERAIDGSPTRRAASWRYSSTLVRSTCAMK